MLLVSLSLFLGYALAFGTGGGTIGLSAMGQPGKCTIVRRNTRLGGNFNATELAVLRRVFTQMDDDSDGELSPREIFNFYKQTNTLNPATNQPLTLKDVKFVMRLVDDDDDGELSLNFRETLALMALFDGSPTSMEQLILRSIYATLDTNSDGAVTIAEIKRGLKTLNITTGVSPEIIQFVVDSLDRGELDEEISMREFLAIGTRSYYRKAFNIVDDDENGKIDAEEFRALVNLLANGPVMPLYQVKTLFWSSGLDKNNNGKLEFNEFLALLEAMFCGGFTNPPKLNYGDLYELWDVDRPKGLDVYEIQDGLKDYFNMTIPIASIEAIVGPTGRIGKKRFIQVFSRMQGGGSSSHKVVLNAHKKAKKFLNSIQNMLDSDKLKNNKEINNVIITNKQIMDTLKNYEFQQSLQTNINSFLLAGIFLVLLVGLTKFMCCKKNAQKYVPVASTTTNDELTA